MSYFPWSQDYAIGIRLIDNDHRELVEQVNALHDQIAKGAAQPQIAASLAFLARYVKDHFAREEGLMAEYGYPGLAEHLASHHKLTARIHAAQKIFADDPNRLDPQKLLLFLREWLIHHILGADREYVPYLHGDAADRKAQPNGKIEGACGSPKAGRIAKVEVEVPADKVEVIRRCAKLLDAGGEIAQEIEALAEPVAAMTLEEARDLIEPLLR